MNTYRRDVFCLLEAGLVGLFFVGAVRFLFATLYAHVSSAALVGVTSNAAALINQPGVVRPAEVELQLIIAGIALAAPLISILLGRLWFGPAVAAAVVAVGRVFLTANGGTTFGIGGAALAAGGGLLYFTVIAVRRPGIMPAGLAVGFAADQIVRLYGSTMDYTWSAEYLGLQTALSAFLFILAAVAALVERFGGSAESRALRKGEISGWGAFALGGLFYLEFAVLGLPNLAAHRVGLDYNSLAPWLVGATLLPLVAEVRAFARSFLTMFDPRYRGWVWFLLIALLLVIGFRFGGVAAASALVGAQFMVSLSFWWPVQPSDGKRNFTGIAMLFGAMFFLLLAGADFFTYEYAFVRGVTEPFASLLRAFRGLELAVALLAVLLVCMPAIVARKRPPWVGGRLIESFTAFVFMVGAGLIAWTLALPVVMRPPARDDALRVASLNLHGGYGLYFGADLPGLADQINVSGVDVLLLQDVDGGRLISAGVDQAAWLARELRMQMRYYPTNASLQGLAVLSRLPIEAADGLPLTTLSKATGVQFVRLQAQDGASLDVFNTQLTLLFRGGTLSIEAGEGEQNAQILDVLDFMTAQGVFVPDAPGVSGSPGKAARRAILGGTFNHGPGSDIYKYLAQRGFGDPFRDQPNERTLTLRLINDAPARVDYLWLLKLNPQFAGITPVIQSSHDMPVVEIRLGAE